MAEEQEWHKIYNLICTQIFAFGGWGWWGGGCSGNKKCGEKTNFKELLKLLKKKKHCGFTFCATNHLSDEIKRIIYAAIG